MSCELLDFKWYSQNVLKIQTKTMGLQPFKLRGYQVRYIDHLKNDYEGGIVRSIVLKPRQAGFSTLAAGYNVHRMVTEYNYRGIFLADKFARTQEVHSIYSTFINHIPDRIKPMVAKHNSDEVLFDNHIPELRVTNPGLGSGFKSETAKDKFAGRSGTRMWAHLTEAAFYEYAEDIDEGVQNSIPLAKGTTIIRESTAYGVSGKGEAFYNLWNAAVAGESVYKPFFVSWFAIPDYSLPVPRGFILTKQEAELVKRCPEITNENLVWRRMKIREYGSGADSIFTPEERFCQDFPSYPEEAFLFSGRPVFDLNTLKNDINELRNNPPEIIKVKLVKKFLAMYPNCLKVYKVPDPNRKYSIGADVAEGVEMGDFSSACVLDAETLEQVAIFHGHIDPDHFGNALVDLAEIYNKAIITPEMNSIGHTTLTAIKERGYRRVYMRSVDDEIQDERETSKMGWRTTRSSKQTMLSKFVALYRDKEIKLNCADLLKEMISLTRESDGDVELTGKDRVVAACLACMGLTQIYEPAKVITPGKPIKVHFETKDLFRDKIHGKGNRS